MTRKSLAKRMILDGSNESALGKLGSSSFKEEGIKVKDLRRKRCWMFEGTVNERSSEIR